ncbi:tyrosyl-tRNA synthetase [Salmonella enterica subsp. enterica]|nr:tyrosyl-tRNA synthetase [Salmonella enterica subsp. enterica]
MIAGENSAIAANNYDWFGSMNVLTFLRDIGKHFSVNQMINKEAVKQRLNRDDQGISFTEFSYNLLQGYDFACLNKLHGVALQIGGSDQWGNITSGIDLTRRLHQNQVFGLTVPLITKADGTKFGKTEGGAVWLDPKKTSPYKFYQFWINTADADVYRFLKFFTFMDIEEINALEEEDKNSGKAPRAQYVLAEQVTRLVHGEEGLVAAKRITECLFSGSLSALSEADFEQLAQDGVPMVEMEKGADLMQALVDAELQPSRGQARKTIASNAVTINGEKQSDPEYIFNDEDRLFGRYTLLRRGKKNYCLICWK